MWRGIEKLIDVGGRVVNSNIAGRIGMGAVFGGLIGVFPLALVLTSGALIPALSVGAGLGVVAGYVYHLGYRDAERYWRRQMQHDLDWRIEQEDKRLRKDE